MGFVRADFHGAMAAVFGVAAIHGVSIAALSTRRVWNCVQRGGEFSTRTTVRRFGTLIGDANFGGQTDFRAAPGSLVSFLSGHGDFGDGLDDGAAIPFAAALAIMVFGRRILLHSNHRILLFAPDFERSYRMASDTAVQPISAVCDYRNVSVRYRPAQCAVRILLH